MSTPFLADGCVFSVNDGTAGAHAAITGVITITPPASETGEWDATALDSTAGTMIKKPKSRAEPGTMSWTMFNDGTEYARLKALQGTEKEFKLTYPNSKIDTWDGFIRKVEQTELQNQEPAKITVTVQVKGLVVRT
jgi:hypothetical protein